MLKQVIYLLVMYVFKGIIIYAVTCLAQYFVLLLSGKCALVT
jgi:hypothetical protein